MSKLYVIGDSTVAEFNDISYFYPRYGYGAVLNKYFDIEIINLALSGRSSKSFTCEANYETLFSNLKKGDYVLIGFGHNDEKADDSFRFSSALLDINEQSSFKHILYYKYAKKIIDLGATPILTTPIIRITPDGKYEKDVIHQTKDGDYSKAIIDLCKEKNILYVDLTKASLDFAKSHSYKEMIIYHAVTKGKMVDDKLTYDEKSVDKTHLSYLGALFSAYNIALTINNTDCDLKKYIKDLKEPKIEELKINPNYKYIPYNTPNIDDYNPLENFKCDQYYGTAFGELDTTDILNSGFYAKGNSGKYIVGQSSDKCYGKINASKEGYAFLFKRIKKSDNFIISAKAHIIKEENIRQAAFGLMLRGDAYLNQKDNTTYNTNYIASGLITTDKVTYATFYRTSTTDLFRVNAIGEFFYKKDEELILEIKRLGQVVKTKVIYQNKIYENTFTDFDYYYDNNYLFVGMFGTNGTLVEFADVKFEITGNAMEA